MIQKDNNMRAISEPRDVDFAILAQKSQLRTEQRWIEQALAELKKQWNSLQIEKLQLESHLAKLLCKNPSNNHPTQQDADKETAETMSTVLSNLDSVSSSESLNLQVPVYSYNSETLNAFELMEEEEEEDDFDEELDLCMFMSHDEYK